MGRSAKNIIQDIDDMLILADQLKSTATRLRSELESFHSSASPKGAKKVDATVKAKILNKRDQQFKKAS